MRSMTLVNDPFRSLLEELIQPRKYGHRVYEGDVGTKDKPSIVVRRHEVERKYKAWRDPDGSYHEQLVEADDIGDEIESYGGTA